MHCPGIEPESQEWESCMIPLHQRCAGCWCMVFGAFFFFLKRDQSARSKRNHDSFSAVESWLCAIPVELLVQTFSGLFRELNLWLT